MSSWINIWLAFSNIFGIPAFQKAVGVNKWLIGMTMLASTLMHISETKHQLIPPYLGKHSKLLLNVDRSVSYIVGPYVLWKLLNPHRRDIPFQWDAFAIGTMGLFAVWIGEVRSFEIYPTFNSIIYPTLHTFWHMSVYYAMYRIL